MPMNFADALATMKRKARLRGRPVSQQEVAGVAEGYARESTGRLDVMAAQKRHRETLIQQQAQFDEKMRQDEKDRRAAEKSTMIKSMIGGAAAGSVAGPVGALFGAGAGLIVGSGGKCIIITACTSTDTHEVERSREYRDKYMSDYHLGGYYALAEAFVPLIERFEFVRLITKRFLVDRLVDYGEWILEHKPKRRLRTSMIVTNGFLSLCAYVGMRIDTKLYIEAHR